MTLKELGIALMLDLRDLLLQKSHIHSTLIWMIVSQKIGVTLMAMKGLADAFEGDYDEYKSR